MAAAAIASAAILAPEAQAAGVDILPQPAALSVADGEAPFAVPARITVGSADKAAAAGVQEVIAALAHNGLKASKGRNATITVKKDAGIEGSEAYTMKVTSAGIEAAASTPEGFYYAGQTIAQLLRQAADGKLPALEITDSPRFGYRGAMIDLARCFQPFDELKRMVDMCAALKINNLHLHLTDDNGWRLEIKSYPKLTEVGAWRVDYPDLIFPARPNTTSAEQPATYGGFYTQRQMRELVKYAQERHVNLIPEIEMPAHAVAAIASYPNLACESVEKPVFPFPGIGGKDASIIMCAGNDSVYTFYEQVLDEVMDIFPSKLIHLGGDEANKHYWERCEKCIARLNELGFTDFEQLQGYFMNRLNSYVRSKGRTAVGWDEVTYGNPADEMVIMGWQGDGHLASDYAAKRGWPFIMTPAKTLYLIRYQGPQWFEPFTYFGNNRLSDVYNYEPVRPEWTDSARNALMGIQASTWTEFCRTPAEFQYLEYPRLLALADAAWRQPGSADWPRFLATLDTWLPELERRGLNYARSMWNVQHRINPNGDGTVTVTLECERPDALIKWGADTAMAMPADYTAPLVVDRATELFASTFTPDGEQQGATLKLDIDFNHATGRQLTAVQCSNGLGYTLVNGQRGSLRNSDFEWAGWSNRTAEFTVDLGRTVDIHSISVGTLSNLTLCVAPPKEIYFYVSENGTGFTPVGSVKPDEQFATATVPEVRDLGVANLNVKARYVRIVAVNPGVCPTASPARVRPPRSTSTK